MRLVTSLLALAAAGAASAGPLLSQQDDSERAWLSAVPDNVTFDCQGRIPGYYADVDSGCQIYHMCGPQSRRYSYLCPAYTEFSQFYMTCVQHDRVNCSMSEKFFHMNEMIGQPRTRFHDHRQHDHSKKKDTEGSKAINRVDASEPAGHILFEFETKMDVSLKKRRRPDSRPRPRPRTASSSQAGSTGHQRSGAGSTKPKPTGAKSGSSTGASPPPTPSPRRLFKTLSPPQATTVVTAPTAAPPTTQPLQSSRVNSSGKVSSQAARGNRTTSTAYKARPRVRFSTPAPVKWPTTPRAPSLSNPVSPPGVPALPRNTYRTFGLPGSFSFGTLLNRKSNDVTPLPLRSATTRGTTRRPTTAPPTRVRSTKAPSTRSRSTKAPSSRTSSTEAPHSRARPTIAPQTKSNLTTERPSTSTSRATVNAPKTIKNVTTTVKPLKLKPRVRLGSTATKAPKHVTNPRTTSRASTESTTARSSTTQTTTPRPTTTPSTTRRSTTRRRTTTSRRTTTTKPTTTRRRTTRPTTPRPTTTKPTTTKPGTTTKSRRRKPSTSRSTTTSKPTTKSTTTKTTTARPTTPKRTTARRTTSAPTTARRTASTPTTARRTTPTPTTARRTTSTPATRPRSRVPQSIKNRLPTTRSSTEQPPAASRPNTSARKLSATASPVPSLLSKELPPIDELEALRLSFTLDPPRLEQKEDGPHEERNMKVRGELITGEMALRKLMVDQLRPVYFPNPNLPLNLLPPLLSEQSRPDGGQTTTLTLPVRRQRPDALLQAAAVAFNILPPELASLVPPMLTPPPPLLPSGGARNTTQTPATSRAKTPATSSKQTPSRPALKPKKDRPGLTMKFGKKKTRFRVGGAHGSSHDACHPCMKSFIKDLDRCHPCVIIR